jgi:hypothetical protein
MQFVAIQQENIEDVELHDVVAQAEEGSSIPNKAIMVES